jgi:hypothetical protein
MSTRTTLRLAGVVAAIAVSVTYTSSALAKPVGMTTAPATGTGSAAVAGGQPSTTGPATVVTVRLHRSGQLVRLTPYLTAGGPADSPADVGTPVIASPVVRADNPAEIGTPASVPLTAPPVQVSSQGFSWQDATLGALAGLALACLAAFAAGTMRGRRGLVLRT